MRDPVEDLKIRVGNIEQIMQTMLRNIADLAPQVADGMSVYNERLDTIEFQFKELEKWHKRMWAVTRAESKIATLQNETGELAYPKVRLKALQEVELTRDDVAGLLETFDTSTSMGKRERDIAAGYWLDTLPLRDMRKIHEISGARIQQIAYKALRKIRHSKIARKLLGSDAPF